MSHHEEWEEYVTASEEIQNLRIESERLRNVIGDIQAKAELGAQCMDEDERGQRIAQGFKVIADFARDALEPPTAR
jgi:hypothetical protein